jgi:hypothetical protein
MGRSRAGLQRGGGVASPALRRAGAQVHGRSSQEHVEEEEGIMVLTVGGVRWRGGA